MMKKLICILVIKLLLTTFLNAQVCHGVQELLRKRHTIAGMTYGHPYTTFDRHNKLSFEQTINNNWQ